MTFDGTNQTCKSMFGFLNNPKDDFATEDDVVPEEPLRDGVIMFPEGAKTRNHELDEADE